MKKFTFTLIFATFATAAFSQTDWTFGTNSATLNPSSANVGIGTTYFSNAKLSVHQNEVSTISGQFFGLNLTSYLSNTNSIGTVFGLYTETKHFGTSGTAYGVYSTVTGSSAINKYSGYFTGGKFAVMNGNVGIETTNPQATLDIASSSANSIRIGRISYQGNLNVPFGAIAAQFNIDFTGYRDINADQVGARIAAIRINNHQPNNALIQKTGLAFYTNPTGMNTGTTDLYERMRIAPDGNIGIGTTNPTEKLDVIGVIRAHEVKVCLNQGCDFVFDKDYKLMPLRDLNSFITENKHLPEIAPAAVMESEGINLSEMNAKLLQKVEELTLYVIDLQKQIDELKK